MEAGSCGRRKSRIAARRRRGPWAAVPGLGGWVNEWEGGREGGSPQAVGLRRAPGCGRCLELLTPAAWLPPASQSSNKRGRRRERRRSQGGLAAPFTQQPKPGQAARAAPWGRPCSGGGGGGGPGEASVSEALSPILPATRSKLAYMAQPSPYLPYWAFESVGAPRHWQVPPGKLRVSSASESCRSTDGLLI